ncbi:hypothetical protein [Neisseria wadsworthii]|uniref:hypothetical protein n=1 Tax=Neisseria wadsworthii TaxID=607711 RepID=UPI0012EAB654|nr:hypothetical protein [Neisseria wadsworthii]QMT35918.1 hypothetical protein H3L96_01245 [Neisseria wadsworthii]
MKTLKTKELRNAAGGGLILLDDDFNIIFPRPQTDSGLRFLGIDRWLPFYR